MMRRGRPAVGVSARRSAPPDPVQLLQALHKQHAAAVLQFALQYTRDEQLAQDVVQETFLRVWRKIERLELLSNPRSYLLTVARNVLTDQWRARGRRPRLVLDHALLERVPGPDDVEAALQRWTIAEAVDRLTAAHREVVQALFFDGLTTAEAATRLHVPEGTIKSRSYYAVRALRTAFEEIGLTR